MDIFLLVVGVFGVLLVLHLVAKKSKNSLTDDDEW
jgi:hypothetical protein